MKVKTAILLSGPTAGIGRELTKKLIGLNHELVLIGRDMQRIASLIDSLNSINVIDCDFQCLIDESVFEDLSFSFMNLAKLVSSEYLIFINNAATIQPICPAEILRQEELEATMRINCTAAFVLAQKMGKIAKEIGKKLLIINVSSGAAQNPVKGWLSYSVSKAAIKLAMDALAEENNHVDIVHFNPGVVDTNMQTYIRSQTELNMPDVEIFNEFKNAGKLKTPSAVADEIIELMDKYIL